MGMIPIDSYHDALRGVVGRRDADHVALAHADAPVLAAWPSMATSQETAPAGSKYFASERKSGTVFPPRVSLRSV